MRSFSLTAPCARQVVIGKDMSGRSWLAAKTAKGGFFFLQQRYRAFLHGKMRYSVDEHLWVGRFVKQRWSDEVMPEDGPIDFAHIELPKILIEDANEATEDANEATEDANEATPKRVAAATTPAAPALDKDMEQMLKPDQVRFFKGLSGDDLKGFQEKHMKVLKTRLEEQQLSRLNSRTRAGKQKEIKSAAAEGAPSRKRTKN